MANTTTFGAIRARYCGSTTARGVLEALTPAVANEFPFERSSVRSKRLREWADGKASTQFRKFELVRSGDTFEPLVLLPDVIMRQEQATLTIAYPVGPALYGLDDLDSMEDLIRSDAHQLRDALLSPGNLLLGCNAVLPTISPPERNETIWFQDIVCELTYYESQTLT